MAKVDHDECAHWDYDPDEDDDIDNKASTKVDRWNVYLQFTFMQNFELGSAAQFEDEMWLNQARRLGGQPASIRSPFLETARQIYISFVF